MKIIGDKLKGYWFRTKHFCVHNILHADDPPHNLALGIAIGIFVAWLPLIGIQMGLAFGIAWLIKGNKAVAVSLVWISNPVTMVPIYYPGYWLGCKLMNMPIGGQWIELMESNDSASVKIRGFLGNLQDFAGPLFLGTFILAVLIGIVSYYSSLSIIRSYRLRRWGQLMPPSLTPKNLQSDDIPESISQQTTPVNPNGQVEKVDSSESAA